MAYMPALSYEAIADGLTVCTSSLHRFGTDAVLLTEFSGYRQKDRVCDFGTGCGIIPMLMQRQAPPQEIYGVDIQPEAIRQMCLGIAESTAVQSVLHPVCADLKNLWEDAPAGQLDLVTCNPPYKAYQAGIESQLTAQKIARHEILCNIYDICRSAKRLLKFGGRLCICNRPERLAELIIRGSEVNLEAKRLCLVRHRADSPVNLVLLQLRKGGKSSLKWEEIVLHDASGAPTEQYRRIYHL